MTGSVLYEVLEATGYLAGGKPAHGVYLNAEEDGAPRFREFSPDAFWRSESALTVYFKYEREDPSRERVAAWHREIWNHGFAPLLWVISPESIAIYNGFSRPLEADNATAHLLGRFGRIEEELDKLDALAGRLAMETGKFWHQALAVDRSTCVDRQLLSDLGALEGDLLYANLDRPSAQGLIGRSIFAQYLIDRKIVTHQFLVSEYGHATLTGILRDRLATKRLFDWLCETFNGDMFPPERSSLPELRHLNRVADFLDAVDPVSGQRTFFPYQFDVIPVELISSIYEQFAHTESESDAKNHQKDVHYTRLSLVSLVLDEIFDGLSGRETVLDLTCGSGVFLVEALRRLVERRCNGEPPNRKVIRSVLYKQVYGVDISEAAVRVATFSLYLAALELDPDPRPPAALKFRPLIGRTLIVGDSTDIEETPDGMRALTKRGKRRTFDVIVGNPPWSYRGKVARATSSRLAKGSTRSPRGVSLDFVSRALDFASGDTRLGMVVSGVQFFSRSATGIAVLRNLVEQLAPLTLVNLSYQSSWLFPKGNLPAMVLLARHRPTATAGITAVQVPWSPAGEQSHTFEIAREDIVTLTLSDWLRKPECLKTAFFGLGRDLALLHNLTDRYKLLGAQLRAFGTEFRAGLKYGDLSRDARFLHGLPLLTKADMQPFVVSDRLDLFQSDKAERPRSRDAYRAPLVLVKEFVKAEGRALCAVARYDAVFTDAFLGATLPREHLKTAQLLAAILSSSLASWFFLMTGSTFGLSMRRLLLRDIEHLPVPALESACASTAGQRLIALVEDRIRNSFTGRDWLELDEAVFDLYDLDAAERIVARDGLVRAGWQWKSGRLSSVHPAAVDTDMLAYTKSFLSAVDAWVRAGGRRRMTGEVFDFPVSTPHRVVRFVLEEGVGPPTTRVIATDGRVRDVLDRISKRLDVRIGESLVGQRTLRVYGPNEVVIVKPSSRRHWMGVSALEDADAVVTDSISGLAG